MVRSRRSAPNASGVPWCHVRWALAVVATFCLFDARAECQQTRLDLARPVTMEIAATRLDDIWRELERAATTRVVGPAGRRPVEVSISVTDTPLRDALGHIAAATGLRWQAEDGAIVFTPSPRPAPDPIPTILDVEEAAIDWLRTLTADQIGHLERKRMLPLSNLTPRQRGMLAEAYSQLGWSLPLGGPDSTPVVGVFFHPSLAIYAGRRIRGVEVRSPYLLLTSPPFRGGPLPPIQFMKDAEGYPVRWSPREAGP